MAAEAIVAMGFATFFPAMSGALPWIGSNSPTCAPILADGNMPIDPVNIAASSLRMSPNILLQSIIIELPRITHELHRRIVDVDMAQLHVRIAFVDVSNHTTPQLG